MIELKVTVKSYLKLYTDTLLKHVTYSFEYFNNYWANTQSKDDKKMIRHKKYFKTSL